MIRCRMVVVDVVVMTMMIVPIDINIIDIDIVDIGKGSHDGFGKSIVLILSRLILILIGMRRSGRRRHNAPCIRTCIPMIGIGFGTRRRRRHHASASTCT